MLHFNFPCQTEARCLIFIMNRLNTRTTCRQQSENFCTNTSNTYTHAHTFLPLSKYSQTLKRNVALHIFFLFTFFFLYSWTKLAQHLSVWGADSSAWQIRAFPARRCLRVLFVCCSCLSRSCLLRWLSNPQALITQSCLSHWYGSACRQSQVWTRPKEVDTTVGCSYCSDFTEKKIGRNSLDFSCGFVEYLLRLIGTFQNTPILLIYLKFLLPFMLINNPVNDHHGSVFAFLTSLFVILMSNATNWVYLLSVFMDCTEPFFVPKITVFIFLTSPLYFQRPT